MAKQEFELGEALSEQTLQWILRNLEGLKYGTVQITVHQGKIVQIDRTEKIRFDKTNS
ncbi:YezD family protein [Cohnella zeiphila]|uniref:YezD family protein n=1 Tax=Cohnella zeiphila TaxID=2761120 RepID=A0A7X0SKL9_9BACL|nr:YezD family protein [Cohnella zeiphila]MBB6731671.1 YezD family protein [Cohnella zeiphila]